MVETTIFILTSNGKGFFSAPELKAQVQYCDHALSVVRLSVVRPSVVNFSHFLCFSG